MAIGLTDHVWSREEFLTFRRYQYAKEGLPIKSPGGSLSLDQVYQGVPTNSEPTRPEPAPRPADQPARTAGPPFRWVIDRSMLAPLPGRACRRRRREPVDGLEGLEEPAGTRWLVECPTCGRQDLRLETAAVARLVAELELEALSQAAGIPGP